MTKKVCLIALAAFVSIMQACVSSKIASNKDSAYNIKPKKLYLIVSSSKDAKTFPQDLYNGLVKNFKTRNIAYDGFVRDPLSLKSDEELNHDLNSYDPDGLLTIKMTQIDIINGGAGGATFELSLISRENKKTVWKANLNVTGPMRDLATVNSAIKTIIGKMQEDQIIETNDKISLLHNQY